MQCKEFFRLVQDTRNEHGAFLVEIGRPGHDHAFLIAEDIGYDLLSFAQARQEIKALMDMEAMFTPIDEEPQEDDKGFYVRCYAPNGMVAFIPIDYVTHVGPPAQKWKPPL